MSNLLDSPSSGQSEVLATLRAEGRSMPFRRLCQRVQFDWGIGDDTFAEFPATMAAVLSALQTAGYVTGSDEDEANVVDLTGGTPADTDRVLMTSSGQAYSRSLSPRPQKDPFYRGG